MTSTITLRGRRGTYGPGLPLVTVVCVAGVALGDIDLRFVWQAWHLVTLTWVLFDTVVAAFVCVAGVALDDIDCHFAWQAWHLVTSTITLRGRRGTYGPGLPLVTRRLAPWSPRSFVAGVALGDIDLRFVWQAWRLVTLTFALRGRRGTYGTGLALVTRLGRVWRCGRRGRLRGSHRPSLCVAGVALGVIDRHFAWQAWRLVTSTVTLPGRRGTYGTGLALVTRLAPVWRCGRRGLSRGRRGTW